MLFVFLIFLLYSTFSSPSYSEFSHLPGKLAGLYNKEVLIRLSKADGSMGGHLSLFWNISVVGVGITASGLIISWELGSISDSAIVCGVLAFGVHVWSQTTGGLIEVIKE